MLLLFFVFVIKLSTIQPRQNVVFCICLAVICALADIKCNLKQAYNIKTEEKNTFFPFFVCFEVHDHLSFACIIEILLKNELYPYAESVLWSSLNDCKNLYTQLYSNVILCNFKVNLISIFEIKSAERQTCGWCYFFKVAVNVGMKRTCVTMKEF